jgi:hypothetical protein
MILGLPRKQTRILNETAAEREAIKRREAVARERQQEEMLPKLQFLRYFGTYVGTYIHHEL